jgi:hypothetical protein
MDNLDEIVEEIAIERAIERIGDIDNSKVIDVEELENI